MLVVAPAEGDARCTVERIASLHEVVAALEDGRLAAAGIDIPIGLPPSGPRRCDLEARRVLGRPRASSVFPAPARAVLEAPSYPEACAASRAANGKAVPMQLFNILDKVREVDGLMTPARQDLLVEVHPEVSFALLGGRPMRHAKRTAAGREERLGLLETCFTGIGALAAVRPPGAAADDVLDAFAAAWSARRWFAGTFHRFGGDLDERGLRMEMIA